MKILFVCLGNICRSPIAEGVFKNKAKKYHQILEVASAGTANYHIGKPPHPLSQQICKMNNIDISHQRAQQYSPILHKDYDYIFALDSSVLSEIKNQLKGYSFKGKIQLITDIIPNYHIQNVPDPYYGDFSNYIEVYEIINELCDAFYSSIN